MNKSTEKHPKTRGLKTEVNERNRGCLKPRLKGSVSSVASGTASIVIVWPIRFGIDAAAYKGHKQDEPPNKCK